MQLRGERGRLFQQWHCDTCIDHTCLSPCPASMALLHLRGVLGWRICRHPLPYMAASLGGLFTLPRHHLAVNESSPLMHHTALCAGIPEPLLMQQLDFISPGSAAALLEALVEQGMLLVKSLALPSPPAFVVRRTVEAVGASAGLTGAAPPSFLCKRRGATAGAPGSQPSVVRHYWPSLEHSWSAPAQAQPPVQVVGGLPAANPVGTRIADVEMHDV